MKKNDLLGFAYSFFAISYRKKAKKKKSKKKVKQIKGKDKQKTQVG